ncbi:MAG: hypothetical protein A2W93_00145 [Bacteroidetes bacterium GWF2_43_63]|nr:MAG: hypothetical protein A2W94_11345 [Bacteroidetes bacterium GWE2_42_42]OFY52691.1 MAG: hypothetical protein A2W93_00145 [Bacteroidetes bacterium GWF2_43_63]HBG69311.1 hypothetical protein [Bacteroidales bacterium]HCB60365.1 hypothetical protein [Bacteroidales bacterium]HCY23648.1 hypothetical protein [Bacteroidales bacterium]
MKEIIQKTLLKNGLYAGGILAAYFLVLYLTGVNFFTFSFVSFIVEATVVLIFMFMSISQVRKMTEEKKINFGHAIILSGGVMLIGLFCYQAMKLLVLFVIDPAYNEVCIDEIYFKSIQAIKEYPQYADKMGNPEDIKKLLLIENNLMQFAIFLGKSIIVGALVALVAKKKDKPEDSLIAQ